MIKSDDLSNLSAGKCFEPPYDRIKTFSNSPNDGEKKLSKGELIAVSELNYLKLIFELKRFKEYILAHICSNPGGVVPF